MVTVDFSMLSLATKTHTSFGITLMRHKILRCRCHKDAGISYILWGSADRYFSKQSVYRLVLTVHLPTCFYSRMRRSLYKVSPQQARNTSHNNFTYRYIDDVLSLKNTKFAEYLEFIYPRELEIKEITETAASSYSTWTMESCLLGFTTNGMTSIFPLLAFHFWAVISLLHQHTAFTFHS